MLLAIDVGNTETVVGLFADDLTKPPDRTGHLDGSEPTGLAHHWRLSTVAERTADEHALLLTQLLDLDGLDIEHAVTGIAVTSSVPLVTANLRLMVSRWFDVPSVVLEPGREERHADPLRQPEGGRCRPDRQRGRRLRPVRRSVHRGRSRHRDDLRRDLRRPASTSVARSHPASP